MTENPRVRSLGWVTGLIITTSLVGGIVGVYQRGTLPVPAAAVAHPPLKELWVPGTWEPAAATYLAHHAYDDVSSVTPPTHRPHHHVRYRHVQSRSAAP